MRERSQERSRLRVWAGRLVKIALGCALGAVLVEVACYTRDAGAFPQLNLYVTDAKLGVHLQPGGRQLFAVHDDPPSEIRINSAGLRGAELPSPANDEILVLGDSQVFGLGVDDAEPFAARLARLTNRPVVNAGVPTYGPLEYNALAQQLMKARKPKLVVYAVNMLDDLFEHSRPNRERHKASDGWAVDAETAPADVFEFPGREWLFGRSHAVYALRRWLQEHGAPIDAPGFASETKVKDLLAEAKRRDARVRATAEQQQKRDDELEQAQTELAAAQKAVTDAYDQTQTAAARGTLAINAPLAEVSPGDVPAARIREAIKLRDKALAQLAEARERDLQALAGVLATRNAARTRLRALRAERFTARPPASAFAPRLLELRDMCQSYGAEAIVVALPIDVQVSSAEWRKYGQSPVDMRETLALTEDLLASARALGMRALDALPALQATEPGAFLDGDHHLTSKGHVAVAHAIAAAIAEPPPDPQPEPGLPAGRSYPPSSPEEIGAGVGDEPVLAGEENPSCSVALLDEWLRASCGAEEGTLPRLRSVAAIEGGRGEVLIQEDGGRIQARGPVLPGDTLRLRFTWDTYSQVLRAQRLPDRSVTVGFELKVPVAEKVADAGAPEQPPLDDDKPTPLCPCCKERYLPERPDCARSFADDCGKQLACIRGDPQARPTCEQGSAPGDPSGRCLPLCSPLEPCKLGFCDHWQGVDVCRPPL